MSSMRIAAGRWVLIAGLMLLTACSHDVIPTDAFKSRASIPRPSRITVVQGSGGAFLNWEAPDSDFVIIDGWNVYKQPPDGDRFRLNLTPVMDRDFVDRAEFRVGFTRYWVTSISRAGVESEDGLPVLLHVDDEPPPPPTGLTATLQPNAILLFWDFLPLSDLDGYNVYRDQTLIGFAGEPSMPAFIDALVVRGVTYTYYVTAVDFQHHESGPSEAVTARLP